MTAPTQQRIAALVVDCRACEARVASIFLHAVPTDFSRAARRLEAFIRQYATVRDVNDETLQRQYLVSLERSFSVLAKTEVDLLESEIRTVEHRWTRLRICAVIPNYIECFERFERRRDFIRFAISHRHLSAPVVTREILNCYSFLRMLKNSVAAFQQSERAEIEDAQTLRWQYIYAMTLAFASLVVGLLVTDPDRIALMKSILKVLFP
jgi:hypothetical protein